jgi:hypothetical protein
MEKLKRSYLNSKEENFYMMTKVMMLFLEGKTSDTKGTENILEVFESAEMLTKSSKKNLKTAITFMNKFLNETYELVDEKQKEKIDKKSINFNLNFVSDYEGRKINRDKADKEKYVVADKELFSEVIDILGQECVNCNKDYKTCNLYNLFDDVLLTADGECKNCKYACKL